MPPDHRSDQRPVHRPDDRAPATRREDLVEDLHGHRVEDPYRWLEAPADDPDVAAFVAAQNAATSTHLQRLIHRESFRARLQVLWDHPRRGAPWRRGAWWFQLRNDGLQDQDLLWCAPAVDGEPGQLPDERAWRVLLDPTTWSTDGTASLTGLAPSHDGRRVAFARSDAGSDWMTWRVVEVASGEVAPDVVPWAKFTSAAWLPDGRGFLYGRYPEPTPGQEHAAATRDQQLRLHRLGTDAAEDPVVHERPDQPEWSFHPRVTHDGRWLVVTVVRGTDPTTRIHVAPITTTDGATDARDGGGPTATIGPLRPLLDDADARYDELGTVGDDLLVLTDLDAPLGRVLAVPLDASSVPRELVAESGDRLEGAAVAGAAADEDPGWLVCRRLHHATARLLAHDPRDGHHLHEVALPGPGTVAAVAADRFGPTLHLTFETFADPTSVLRHDLDAGASTLAWAAASEPTSVVVDQVRVHHDGVAVPVFVVHRTDVVPDGHAATILWGYGGFEIPVTPMYRVPWRAWVDAGGVLAVACLRGGGEYGRTWHDDGRLDRKQHVFDDALACAAWLTGRDRARVHASALTPDTDPDAAWSAPDHLGIEGRSNGGLLVGACLTQQPASFGSAVPEVGVLDMARFHRFTIGWAWTSDYGSPDDPDDLGVLLGYSPYHRIVAGTAYPPTLVTTGDTDDRVVPAHSYKFAAALQHAQAGDAPVLLRVDTSAGHGAGKPVSKLIEERADVLAFHAHHLGLGHTADDADADRGPRAGRGP